MISITAANGDGVAMHKSKKCQLTWSVPSRALSLQKQKVHLVDLRDFFRSLSLSFRFEFLVRHRGYLECAIAIDKRKHYEPLSRASPARAIEQWQRNIGWSPHSENGGVDMQSNRFRVWSRHLHLPVLSFVSIHFSCFCCSSFNRSRAFCTQSDVTENCRSNLDFSAPFFGPFPLQFLVL